MAVKHTCRNLNHLLCPAQSPNRRGRAVSDLPIGGRVDGIVDRHHQCVGFIGGNRRYRVHPGASSCLPVRRGDERIVVVGDDSFTLQKSGVTARGHHALIFDLREGVISRFLIVRELATNVGA